MDGGGEGRHHLWEGGGSVRACVYFVGERERLRYVLVRKRWMNIRHVPNVILFAFQHRASVNQNGSALRVFPCVCLQSCVSIADVSFDKMILF